MTTFKHAMSQYFSKAVHHHHTEHPIAYHTSSLDTWPSELVDKPDRFVHQVETCFAHTMTPGHDGHPPSVDKDHLHTFLRVTLAPSEDHPEETIFVERVLTQEGGAAHSVIPIAADETSPPADAVGDTLHDHACIILDGSPSALIHADHLEADRTTRFSNCPDRRLSLLEFATILRFVSSHGLHAVSLGLDTACETYSRWFCRATMGALLVVMRRAFWHLNPPKGEVATRIEMATQRSVDAWLTSTFKVSYPAREVADENLKRQMDVMTEEEKAKKLQQIAEREEELEFKAKVQAAYEQLKLNQSKASM